MQDLNDKITSDTLTATEWNEVPSEIQNAIEGLGQALSSGDLNQLGKSIAGYVSNGTFYTDSGIADAYVLSKIGSKQSATTYTDGFYASFIAGNTNTGSSTVNIAGLGIRDIIGTEVAGAILSGEYREIRYRASSGDFVLTPLDARSISYTPTGASSVIRDARTKLREIISVEDFGVSPLNTIAQNTSAIQAAWDSKPARLLYPPGDIEVNTLNLPDATIMHIGSIDMRAAARSRLLYNSAGTATEPVINLSSMSAGLASSFENINVDTNDRASYGFYLASGTAFQAIKNMLFSNIWVMNLKAGAVGWQIGDQTNTGFDTDAFNHLFSFCNTRGSTDSIGWVIDATNAYNTSFYSCSNGRKDGSNFMLTGIKVIRGSGTRIYNYFGDKLQATGSPWVFDSGAGTFEVFGVNTEDRRVAKARSSGENDSSLLIHGCSVNDETGNGDTCLDTTVRTSLDNCTFGSASYNRKLIATNQLTTNHVFLGSTGEYDLSAIALNSSVIEGHAIGTKLDNIAVNELCDLWVSVIDPSAPEGWVVQKGTGAGTVIQDSANAEQGQFTLDINCTVTSNDIFGVINKNYADIDVRPFRGKTINFYGIFHRVGTAAPEIQVLLDGASTNVTGGAIVLETAASGGTVLVWGKVDVQAASNTLSQIEMGIPATLTGHVYLDSFGIIPYDFSSYIPALFVLAKNTGYDRFISEIRAGTLRLGDATYWTDGSNKYRINVGDRNSDVDGQIVGTQI